MAVIDALEDLLDAVRRVRLAVELARNDVLEQLAARHPRISNSHRQTAPNQSKRTQRYLQVEDEVVKALLLYAVVQPDCKKRDTISSLLLFSRTQPSGGNR